MFNLPSSLPRILFEIDLQPVQGSRFQPTGFPDLGAATYFLPDGTRMLLVESAQSMANRLESTIISPDNELIADLNGLSYIRADLTGESRTSTNSLIEAHRINSPFIISDQSFQQQFASDAGYRKNQPIDWRRVAAALFKYDINSLIHGAFLANLEDGRLKIPRSLSSFIEARNIQEVVSGGVKNNPIDPTGSLRAENYDKDVYSNVPYQRLEYTAEQITAFFNLDTGLLSSYHLPEEAYWLLIGLALFKTQRLLGGGLRLRTACDLKPVGPIRVTEPVGFELPEPEELRESMQQLIRKCQPLFASPPVTTISTPTVIKKKKDQEA